MGEQPKPDLLIFVKASLPETGNKSRDFSYSQIDMPSEINIEQMIRDAMDKGEFDDLPGKGKPLDLDAYFSTPEDVRMAYALLKSNEFVPEELELLREASDLRARLDAADQHENLRIRKRLSEIQLKLDLARDHARRRR
jgi:hypothetical protein